MSITRKWKNRIMCQLEEMFATSCLPARRRIRTLGSLLPHRQPKKTAQTPFAGRPFTFHYLGQFRILIFFGSNEINAVDDTDDTTTGKSLRCFGRTIKTKKFLFMPTAMFIWFSVDKKKKQHFIRRETLEETNTLHNRRT